MTGFNHYPDCTCGWCVYSARSHFNRFAVAAQLKRSDALSFLARNSANSPAGCYVKPNARCPECGKPVFYYANAYGSRVFFDDLGPPWPKHPCTDRPEVARNVDARSIYPAKRRANGLVQELLEQANIAGISWKKVFGERDANEWTLGIVISVDQRGDECRLTVEYLDSRSREKTTFSFRARDRVLDVGQFVSLRRDEISFVHDKSLSAVVVKAGGAVRCEPSPSPESKVQRAATPAPIRGTTELIPGKGTPNAPEDLTAEEMIHFHTSAKSVLALCHELEPVLLKYLRSGMFSPKKIAYQLHAEEYRTACGARWTSRLVFFLCALMFPRGLPKMKFPKRRDAAFRAELQWARAEVAHGLTRQGAALGPAVASAPLPIEELAQRLASLGRVTVGSRRA